MINLIQREPKSLKTRARRPDLNVDAGRYNLALSTRTYIMGVLNVTPDSFSDGGRFFDCDNAVQHAVDLAAYGADIIDIGGESTRPGAGEISVEEELDRVIPVLEAISGRINIPISIDTRKARVAESAIKAGAVVVNDVSALKADPYMATVIARYEAAVILMHMRGTPSNMQDEPRYRNVMKEILSELKVSMEIGRGAGIKEKKMIIDPGIGFGKTVNHNLEILNRLEELTALGRPICVGTSRKSFIGKVLGKADTADRLAGTLATCTIAVMNGANILRVHDVREALQASRMADSVLNERFG
jgi:dihydropteroate synthase